MAQLTSFEVFMGFVSRENGETDASRILSRPCFEKWLRTRKAVPKSPHRAFKDAIKTIVLANNRCRPFPPDVEKDLLRYLREEQVWECFRGDPEVNIGKRGWKIVGYHEGRASAGLTSAAALTADVASPKSTRSLSSASSSSKRKRSWAEETKGYSTDEDVASPLLVDQSELNLQQPKRQQYSPHPEHENQFSDGAERSRTAVPINPQQQDKEQREQQRQDLPIWDDGWTSTREGHAEPVPELVFEAGLELDPLDDDEEEITDPDGVVAAYEMFETLLSLPAPGFDAKKPVMQELFNPAVTQRFAELRRNKDPRLEADFICPYSSEFVPGRPTMTAVAEYALNGTPFVCVRADEIWKHAMERDPVGEAILASESLIYDAWIVHKFRERRLDKRLATGGNIWGHGVFHGSRSKNAVVLRYRAKLHGPSPKGIYVEIVAQDVSDLYPEIRGLPPLTQLLA